MAKLQSMASGDNTIPGSPSEYYSPAKGEGLVSPILAAAPTSGGTTAMRGVSINYPNSNVAGIRGSINDGSNGKASGAMGKKVGAGAPQRHPVNGKNPEKPIQRKPKR